MPPTDEFRRVAFPAEFLPGEEALVYSSGSSLRPDATGPGYWVFAPARLTGGSIVVVNRGFVPEGKQNPDTRKEGRPSGMVDIVGVMRWPEQRGQFTPADEPQQEPVVRARSGRDGEGEELGHRRAILRGPGSAAAAGRPAESRSAEGEPSEQSPAICGNMVWSGGRDPCRGGLFLAFAAARCSGINYCYKRTIPEPRPSL